MFSWPRSAAADSGRLPHASGRLAASAPPPSRFFHPRLVAQGGSYRDRIPGAAVEQVARHCIVVAL